VRSRIGKSARITSSSGRRPASWVVVMVRPPP
jgi:hypothetical protein